VAKKGREMNKTFDKRLAAFGVVLAVLVTTVLIAVVQLSKSEQQASEIHVRCIGDHLVFESLRTGDIQVIANKCKKQYSKRQAPVTPVAN
jgi:hypothetical protein